MSTAKNARWTATTADCSNVKFRFYISPSYPFTNINAVLYSEIFALCKKMTVNNQKVVYHGEIYYSNLLNYNGYQKKIIIKMPKFDNNNKNAVICEEIYLEDDHGKMRKIKNKLLNFFTQLESPAYNIVIKIALEGQELKFERNTFIFR